ncbi:uncharacterized protein LOC111089460 [Limulus polyphemus]|uniref:Uncharacterized protein LOC111089460 n=1 Tax=Limulus polyphemus TaxID=6850 RepID=A0ABM1TPA3_LIMPO|nr:uncharacterized protein LOC111089460 [Limulus polyphemus]
MKQSTMKLVLCFFILFVLVVISHAQYLQHCNRCGSLNLQQRRVCCNYGFTQCCRIRVPPDQTFPGSGAPGQGGYPGSSGGLAQPGIPNYYATGSAGFYPGGTGGSVGVYPGGVYPGGAYPQPLPNVPLGGDVILRKKPAA